MVKVEYIFVWMVKQRVFRAALILCKSLSTDSHFHIDHNVFYTDKDTLKLFRSNLTNKAWYHKRNLTCDFMSYLSVLHWASTVSILRHVIVTRLAAGFWCILIPICTDKVNDDRNKVSIICEYWQCMRVKTFTCWSSHCNLIVESRFIIVTLFYSF